MPAQPTDSANASNASSPSFAYSFDRENFVGSFRSRRDAVTAAVEAAKSRDDSPSTVFVGQQITPNPRAFGHARSIVSEMRRRVIEDHGDVAEDFLRNLSEKDLSGLDTMIETTIVQWLHTTQRTPKFRSIEAISEHLIPQAASNGR